MRAQEEEEQKRESMLSALSELAAEKEKLTALLAEEQALQANVQAKESEMAAAAKVSPKGNKHGTPAKPPPSGEQISSPVPPLLCASPDLTLLSVSVGWPATPASSKAEAKSSPMEG